MGDLKMPATNVIRGQLYLSTTILLIPPKDVLYRQDPRSMLDGSKSEVSKSKLNKI